jgi:hypothetical protein
MEVRIQGRELLVVLSRRNVLTLLHKLDHMGDSACTLVRACGPWTVILHAEPDAQHYAERDPGAVHPATEQFLGGDDDA